MSGEWSPPWLDYSIWRRLRDFVKSFRVLDQLTFEVTERTIILDGLDLIRRESIKRNWALPEQGHSPTDLLEGSFHVASGSIRG